MPEGRAIEGAVYLRYVRKYVRQCVPTRSALSLLKTDTRGFARTHARAQGDGARARLPSVITRICEHTHASEIFYF